MTTISSIINIDGITYNVPVISLIRHADFLDKSAERTLDGVLHREMIGVFFNYELVLAASSDTGEYQALWDAITEPEEFHTIIVPDKTNGTKRQFTAYFSSIKDELIKSRSGLNYWNKLTIHFIAKRPAATP
jgi:hypothetical protein